MKLFIVKSNHNFDGGDKSVIVGVATSLKEAQVIMFKGLDNFKDEHNEMCTEFAWKKTCTDTTIYVEDKECQGYWFLFDIVETEL